MMARLFCEFARGEEGQDLIEYTLLLALVCLGSAALMANTGHSVEHIWRHARKVLRTPLRKEDDD